MKKSRGFFRPALVCMVVALYASAADSAYLDYTLDYRTDVVSGSGYEWLRWDQTLGMSITEATDTYSPAGWRVASNSEMAFLFNDFNLNFGGLEPFDSDENTDQSVLEPANDGAHRTFLQLFGLTEIATNSNPFDGLLLDVLARALFGTDQDEDGLYNHATVVFNHNLIDPITLRHLEWTDADAALGADRYTRDFSSYVHGVALVRDVNPIPLPGALPLFASAMLVFGWFYRRKKIR